MTIARKLDFLSHAAGMTWAVARNTGLPPRNRRYEVTIETTSVCNLACPLCPTGMKTLKREDKFISMERFRRILELTAPLAQGYVLSIFGEPTFHPRLADILAATVHLPTWLSTNLNYGEDAARELARWEHLKVICSVDTLNPDAYPEYRVNGDYGTVLRNLEILSRGRCEIYPQFLVSADEFDEAAFIAFAEKYRIPRPHISVKTKVDYFSLKKTDEPVPGVCHSPYTGFYFNCDGWQVPCCNNVRKDLFISRVDDIGSTDELLRGSRIARVRRRLGRDKNAFPSCGSCPGLNFWKKDFKQYAHAFRSLLPCSKKAQGPTRIIPHE